MMNILEAIE
jgi:hypothetical protein